MKIAAVVVFMVAFPAVFYAQAATQNVSPAQLQAVIGLPLDEAIKQRETYKVPLKAAFERQVSMSGKDCQAESKQGQQPYNICVGHASERADKDFAIFYNNLQMLCHDQDQLTTMQASEKAWQAYKDAMLEATHAAWPDGTGAPGFAGQVYLSLVRDRMRELDEIYGLNIAQ